MILFFTDPMRDYGADYLAHGLASAYGADTLVDFPRKAAIHWEAPPVFDCDVNLDTFEMTDARVKDSLSSGSFNLIVIPTLRGIVPQLLAVHRELLRRNADRIVFCDMEDHAYNMTPALVEILGFRPAATFKRELPIGETWAKPLPFGYPAERVQPLDDTTRPRGVIYAAQVWQWAEGKLRDRLGPALLQAFNGRADVFAPMTGGSRRSIEDYHKSNRRALIAVSPAGQGYHTNRHLEIVADGCCPVYEAPWRQWPNGPSDGVECRFFRDELECVDVARELLNEPEQAREMAIAAQRWLLDNHTTAHRAREIMGAVSG